MRNHSLSTACLILLALSAPALAQKTLYVSPDGQPTSPGTQAQPLSSLAGAVSLAQPGDTIQISPGVYYESKTIVLGTKATADAPIHVTGPIGNPIIIDFSAESEDKLHSVGIELSGDYWYLTSIEVTHAGSFGFHITGSHNTLDHCISAENRNSGTQIETNGSYTLIEDCQSYRNFDPKTYGEDADGFTAKHNIGPGNEFLRCTSYQNADDGFDFWMAPKPLLVLDCVSFRNGYNLWGIWPYEGDGNGFKFGGNYVDTAHICRNCVSIENPLNGFDQNHNIGPLTIENCVAIRCGKGFSFPEVPRTGQVYLRNDTSFGCQNVLAPGVITQNCNWHPDVQVGVLGPLPRPGHRDIPGAGEVPTTEPSPTIVPAEAPEWGYPSDTPKRRDPELADTRASGQATRPSDYPNP
jgi:hypothetical protein